MQVRLVSRSGSYQPSGLTTSMDWLVAWSASCPANASSSCGGPVLTSSGHPCPFHGLAPVYVPRLYYCRGSDQGEIRRTPYTRSSQKTPSTYFVNKGKRKAKAATPRPSSHLTASWKASSPRTLRDSSAMGIVERQVLAEEETARSWLMEAADNAHAASERS